MPEGLNDELRFHSETDRLRYHLDREFCQRGIGSPFAPADDARLVRWLTSGIGAEIEVPDRFGQVYRYSRSHGNLSVERFAKEQPRVPAGSPEGGQFGKKAGANSGASMSIPKNADAKPLPDDWAQRYATNSWGHAGFIGPDGTLYGLEGRHRPMLNELGAKSAPGEEGNTAEVASEYGLIRATSFHSEFAAETWGQPTLSQLEILVSKADSSPAFSFEVTDRKGEMKDWKKWREGDSRPGIGELKAFVIRALGESSTR